MPQAVTPHDYLRAFCHAAEAILKKLVREPVTRGGPLVQLGGLHPAQAVNVVVGITGGACSQVSFAMTPGTARWIASRMTGKDVLELDEMALSAVRELSNIIAGTALSYLVGVGERMDLTPPSLTIGEPASACGQPPQAMTVPFRFHDWGSFFVTVGLRKGEEP